VRSIIRERPRVSTSFRGLSPPADQRDHRPLHAPHGRSCARFVINLISDENDHLGGAFHGTIGPSITPSVSRLPGLQDTVQGQFAGAAANLLQQVVPPARLRATKMVAPASRRAAGPGHRYRWGPQCHPGGGARSSACCRYYLPASSTGAEATRSPSSSRRQVTSARLCRREIAQLATPSRRLRTSTGV
jgi:hypothetical protein